MSQYKKLLSCWHKLEHFSPAPVPKGNKVGPLNGIEPWKRPYRLKNPKKTLEYTVYLGGVDSTEVNDFVKTYFKDDKKEENFRKSKICYASLKLDIDGNYITDSFGISTLPWALGRLEKNQIKNDDWLQAFDEVKEQLAEFIEQTFIAVQTTDDNEIIDISTVVSEKQLLQLQDKIDSVSGWSVIPKKEIYIKRIEKYKPKKEIKTAAVTDILNSFYIKDLEQIISKYKPRESPKAFQAYLEGCLGHTTKRTDVVKNVAALQQNLTPENYPDGCWPSDYTLSVMQQYAVNTIFNSLAEPEKASMFSVNGPPGTGKTTLLRDVIAPILVKRAKELVKIKNPAGAFKCLIDTKSEENGNTYDIWEPMASLANFGMVVVSSNNGAVENISKELPQKEQVSEHYRSRIGYFKKVAEDCTGKENWGIISAVLGNKKNRSAMVSSLWFNADRKNLKTALKEDKIFDVAEWEKTKAEFAGKLKEVTAEKKRLRQFKKECENKANTEILLIQITGEHENHKSTYVNVKLEYEKQHTVLEELQNKYRGLIHELSVIKASKPGFFTYWFSKLKRNAYKKASAYALEAYNKIADRVKIQTPIVSKLKIDVDRLETLLQEQEKDIARNTKKLARLSEAAEAAKTELKDNYADSEFWSMIESKKSQESCPWYSDTLKVLQSELFILALKVNEIFILTANAKSGLISTTVSAFFNYLKGDSKASKKEIKAMWDTFFLVIPVISSTFASVQSMFKDLDKEDIPWLFIDEAGQAIPQAAAGAIWRSKRVAVVGDPFQIEPVVTIPDAITENIGNYFDLGKDQVSAELSVQSIADSINPLGTYLSVNGKEEWIGIPLRVHRRCIGPMFEISNSIAYDNTMYCSTAVPENVNINFETGFLDFKGRVVGRHFVQEQADKVGEILADEIALQKGLPDVFIITPFSEIASELKTFLLKSVFAEVKNYHAINRIEMGNWLEAHVGTIHTFQGKQAEGVILCLGLDEKTQGAVSWASQKPNILNVAITRAKYRFIAIGDKNIWLKQPYFDQLKMLDRK